MSTSKEALLSRLLQPESAASSSGKSLIQVVGGDVDEVPKLPETTPTPAVANIETKSSVSEKRAQDDQPSILEMMMAAQREAKAEKDKDKALEETKASAKPLGGGFKKGFFGGGASSKPKTKLTSTTTPTPISSVSKPEVVEIKKTAATAAKSIPFVFEEVQKAMEEDTHPLLKQLQSNGKISSPLLLFTYHLVMRKTPFIFRLDDTGFGEQFSVQQDSEQWLQKPQVYGGHAAAAEEPQRSTSKAPE